MPVPRVPGAFIGSVSFENVLRCTTGYKCSGKLIQVSSTFVRESVRGWISLDDSRVLNKTHNSLNTVLLNYENTIHYEYLDFFTYIEIGINCSEIMTFFKSVIHHLTWLLDDNPHVLWWSRRLTGSSYRYCFPYIFYFLLAGAVDFVRVFSFDR